MIIDSHCHWLPDSIISNAHFYSKAWGDIEAQVALMDKSGVDKAVLTYPTSDAHLKLNGIKELCRIYNDNVAKVIKRFPDKFIAAAALPFSDSKDMLDELKRSVEELGFKAITLPTSFEGIYLDDKRFTGVYNYAQKANLPVFVHSQIVNPIGTERVQDPLLTPVIEYVFDTTMCIGKLMMSGTLQDYNGVKFVFAYFGWVVCFLKQRFDATYRMLRSINFVKDLKSDPAEILRNIYVDTSGDTNINNFKAALELVGPEHILWGSDWPAKKDIASSMGVVKSLEITSSAKDNILGGNLKRILGI